LPFAARRNPLLHVPHYNAPLLYSGNLLLTIHDLTHLLYAGYRENWKTKMYASPLLHLAAVRAAHIFTVSEYSKTKLVEVLRVDPARITVVYNGVASGCGPGNKEEARDEVARQFGVGRPYILYVGSLKPHKNLETLVDAYGLLCGGTTTPEFQLVLAGAGRQGQERLMRRAVDLGLRPLFIGDADDVELVDLYRAAEVVVLPSLEEGFGLPIVEAMACGTPVICAHAASMPEIAGDAALFFDPLDANDLCRVLRQVLSSKDLSDSLSARGLLRAQQFSWDRTAARHIPVYDRYLM
jgi:glycosyltransferase involved in cell wall biosynthesis